MAHSTSVGRLHMPGDQLDLDLDLNDFRLQSPEKTRKTILGPGLVETESSILVSKPGVLKYREPGVYWIDCHQKRYVPYKGDSVLGIVTQKAGDIFRVDIGGSEQASLSYLSFEGATKRNRPDVKVGDTLYAKLLVANKDMEPEIVCIDSYGRSSGMGVIRNGGFMFQTSLNLVRKLLNPQCVLLKSLGNRILFEIAVGMNGRVWVRSKNDVQTIAIVNAIFASEFMNNDQILAMSKKLSRVLSGMNSAVES